MRNTLFHRDSLRTDHSRSHFEPFTTWPCPTSPAFSSLPVRPMSLTSTMQAVGCSHPGASALLFPPPPAQFKSPPNKFSPTAPCGQHFCPCHESQSRTIYLFITFFNGLVYRCLPFPSRAESSSIIEQRPAASFVFLKASR